MTRVKSVILFALCLSLSLAAQSAPPAQAAPSALAPDKLLANWRKAVSAPAKQSAAHVITKSTQDGIDGTSEEWLTQDGRYRDVTKRQFDQSELVISPSAAARIDWNGYRRDVEGFELKLNKTAVAETETLIFGPGSPAISSTAVQLKDGAYPLTLEAPGARPITWYIDARTWLPVKSEFNGDDTVISTTYSGWKNFGNGALTPESGKVSETDKPDFTWHRVSVKRATLAAQAFALPQPGPSDTHMQANIPAVPFTFEANHIVFPVSVNGRPPVGFLLDTGADQEVINSTRMADFGLKTYARTATTGGGNATEYDFAAGATFTLPGVELKDQHVAVLDQTGLEQALGIPLGGILGYDFISRFVMEIDYDKKLITLHDPATWKYVGNGVTVPIAEFNSGIPYANGTISVPTKPDIPAHFVLDFGAAETMTLTSPFVKANDLARLAQTNAMVNRPAGMEKQFFAQNNVRGRVQELKLGGLDVKDIPINMSVNTTGAYASENFSGTIGETIYQRYRAFLDYARKRVILEPTPAADKPFPERQTYGLSLLAAANDLHKLTVVAVRPGSGAESQGFKKGDVVTAVDGKPASEVKLSEVRDLLSHAGEKHEIDVSRGGTAMHIPVVVTLVSLDR